MTSTSTSSSTSWAGRAATSRAEYQERRAAEEAEAKRRREEEAAREEAERVRAAAEAAAAEAAARAEAEAREKEAAAAREREERERERIAVVEAWKGRVGERAAALASNVGAVRPSAAELKQADSSVKKNGAFLKKAGTVTGKTAEAVLRELRGLNQSKYVSEVAGAMAEHAEEKVRPADLAATVEVVCALHQRYAEFAEVFVPLLIARYQAAEKAAGEGGEGFGARKVLLRLLTELVAVGVVEDGKVLLECLRRVPPATAPSAEAGLQGLGLAAAFARQAGEELLGVRPWSVQVALRGEVVDVSAVGEASVRESLLKGLNGHLRAGTQAALEAHRRAVARERANAKRELERGEVDEANKAKAEELRKAYDALWKSCLTLADALGQEPPGPPEEEEEEEEEGVADVGQVGFGEGFAKGEDGETGWFDDEETHKFYERLPDLRLVVPAALLGDMAAGGPSEAGVGAQGEGSGGPAGEADEDDGAGEDDDAHEREDDEVIEDDLPPTKGARMMSIMERLLSCESAEMADGIAEDFCYCNSKGSRRRLARELVRAPWERQSVLPYYSRIVAILGACMPDIIPLVCDPVLAEFRGRIRRKEPGRIESKMRVAKFAGELCKFRLVHPAKIFYCLKLLMEDFKAPGGIDMIGSLLECCGRYLYKRPDTTARLQAAIDAIRKLAVAKNLDERNTQLIQNALLACRPPERAANRAVVRSDVQRYVRWLIFVFDGRRPGATAAPAQTAPAALAGGATAVAATSTTEAVSAQMSEEAICIEVVKHLRRLDWSPDGPDNVPGTVVDCLLRVWEGGPGHVRRAALITAALGRIREAVVCDLIDTAYVKVLQGLAENAHLRAQKTNALVRYLGELVLARQSVLEAKFGVDLLYLLISHGHPATLYPPHLFDAAAIAPLRDTKAEWDAYLRQDPPNDFFRVTLCVSLLNVIGRTHSKGPPRKGLERFMLYFQRYYLAKVKMPLSVQYSLDDLFADLAGSVPLNKYGRPKRRQQSAHRLNLPRFTSLEEASRAVAEMEKLEYAEALKKFEQQQAKNSGGATGQAGPGGGPDGASLSNVRSDHLAVGEGKASALRDGEDVVMDEEDADSDRDPGLLADEDVSDAETVHSESESESDGEEEEDEMDYESEEEEDVVGQGRGPKKPSGPTREEIEDFDKEFASMMGESLKAVHLSKPTTGGALENVDISMVKRVATRETREREAAGAERQRFRDDFFGTSGEGEYQDAAEGVPGATSSGTPPSGMKFTLLSRKGAKGMQTRVIDVPLEARVTRSVGKHTTEDDAERAEVKRLVLNYEETELERSERLEAIQARGWGGHHPRHKEALQSAVPVGNWADAVDEYSPKFDDAVEKPEEGVPSYFRQGPIRRHPDRKGGPDADRW